MIGLSVQSSVKVRPGTWVLVTAIALTVAASWLVVAILGELPANSGHDFRLMYSAAKMLREHQSPYDPSTFLGQAASDGIPRKFLVGRNGQLDQPFVYPPLLAWFVIPLTYLSPFSALAVWRAFGAACVFVGAVTHISAWAMSPAARTVRDPLRRLLLAVLVTASPLAVYALYWGNPVVLVFGAMGGWVYLLTRGRQWTDILAGCLMTVAILKPQLAIAPAVLATMSLVTGPNAWVRRRHVALGFVTSATALLAMDVVFTGTHLLVAWPGSVLYLSRLIYTQPDMPSLLGLLQATLLRLPRWIWSVAPLLSVLAGTIVTVYLYSRLRNVVESFSLLAILTVTWCFLTPYAHANDELLLLSGGLTVTGTLAATMGRLWQAACTRRWRKQLRFFAWDIVRTYFCLIAVFVLWCGGILLYLRSPQAQLQPLAAAPVPILISLALCWQDIRRRPGLPNGQAMLPGAAPHDIS